jgi:molybdopterin/thiamine biosynthesis adenylyltransferase/rhodanese-related sulfurtransferase
MSYLSRIAEAAGSVEFSSEELAYYARHLLLPGIGTLGQRKLKAARVLVVGAGGLGCPVLQSLAGAGVGHITIVDGDTVAVSNLARQWLHRYQDIGGNKAQSAVAALRELNPFIELEMRPVMLESSNAAYLIMTHDVVVDATDDLQVRYLMDSICAESDRPWVHAGLYRERAQWSVFWARCGARFAALYPEPSAAPSCAGAGMLGAVASVAAHWQALEVIKLITGNAPPKVGELCSLHAMQAQIQSFKLPGVTAPALVGAELESTAAHAWTLDRLRQAQSIGESVRIIDLRSEGQFAQGSLAGAERHSAESILAAGLVGEQKVLLVCEAGWLSSMLAEALRSRGAQQVFQLEGGWRGS